MSGYRFALTWRREDRWYGTEYAFATATEAAGARRSMQAHLGRLVPSGAEDAELSELHGPDIRGERPSASEWQAGMARVRAALASCSGPLAAGLARAARVHVPPRADDACHRNGDPACTCRHPDPAAVQRQEQLRAIEPKGAQE